MLWYHGDLARALDRDRRRETRPVRRSARRAGPRPGLDLRSARPILAR